MLTVPLSTITCQQVKLNTLVQNYSELNFRSIHNCFLSYLIFSNQYFKSIMFMFLHSMIVYVYKTVCWKKLKCSKFDKINMKLFCVEILKDQTNDKL